jgi:AbrB family looped-hinge helix DNA binding protein
MRGTTMPLATVKDKFQVTIPAPIRKKVAIGVGDLVEFILEPDGSIKLLPKSVVDKRQAAVKFFDEFMKGVKPRGEFADMTEDEIMTESVAIIKEVRKEKKTKF